MTEFGTAARTPLAEAFDVMVAELDDIVERVLCPGRDEVAYAKRWLALALQGRVGEPPAGRENPGPSGNAEMHSGGSPTRHLVVVPEDAA